MKKKLSERLVQRARFELSSLRQSVVEVDGIMVRLGRGLSRSVKRALFYGEYETVERKLLERILRPGDVVMELGTGLGVLSAVAALRVGSGNVHTYEANKLLELAIRDTYKINSVCPSVNFCMVGEGAGEAKFFVSEDFWSSSANASPEDDSGVSVPVRAFGEEVARVRPTVLIVDIEGGELDLFRYADISSMDAIILEIHIGVIGPEGAREIQSLIEKSGLKIIDKVSVSPHEVWAAVREGRGQEG